MSKVKKKKRTKVRIPDEMRHLCVPMSKLKLWKDNPRDNEESARNLSKVIKKHGFLIPIIATKDGKIRSGNTRYKAAKLLGMKKVPAILVKFPSDAKSIAFALADNKSSEWAKWDRDLLIKAMNKQQTVDIADLQALTGFRAVEIQSLIGTGLPDAPDGLEDALPDLINPSGVAGEGDTLDRFIIVFRTDEEKKFICKTLGIDGKKTVYTLPEMKLFKGKVPSKKVIKKRKGK